jgi:SAM-dependent methyltransferase
MKVYDLPKETIERSQNRDPLLRHLTDKILGLIDVRSGRVLDVGCGAGRVAIALALRGFQVDALDIASDVVDQARQLAERSGADVRWFVGDFTQRDSRFPDAAYDIAVCSEVLEHVGPWSDILENIARILKPGGLLLLTTPNDPKQFSVLDEYAGHVRRFRWAELQSGLSRFTVLKAFTVGFPFTRAVHWTYTRLALPLVFRQHDPDRMWRPGSIYERLGAEVFYRLAKFDDLFNSLKWGTTWVVKARRRDAHVG